MNALATLMLTGMTLLGVATTAWPQPSFAQSVASVPDISGTWVYPFCCGFVPPLSGPGPVVNKSRAPQPNGADGRPWRGNEMRPLVSNNFRFEGDYTNPILKPAAAQVVKKHGEIESSGVPYPTPRNQCWPEGVPFIFANMGMRMVQQPDKITIFYEYDHQVRRVRMNASHPAHVTPSWYGDSVGRYDGGALVVDTVGVKIGPFSLVDWFGTPYTDALHVVERYRLIEDEETKEAEERTAKEYARMPRRGSAATRLFAEPNYKGKALQLEFTVEDDGVFMARWSAVITYWRSFDEWPEHVCAESPRSTYVVRDSDIPRADKPDF